MASLCILLTLHPHSRKLMQQLQQEPAPRRSTSLDENASTVLALILCLTFAAVGVSIVVRCVLRVARWLRAEPAPVPCFTEDCEAAERVEREAALRAAMSGPVVYSPESASSGGGGPDCPICLAEFAAGERVRVLPNCEHRFHAQCVDRWLEWRLSCPTCRRCVFDDEVCRSGSARGVDDAC